MLYFLKFKYNISPGEDGLSLMETFICLTIISEQEAVAVKQEDIEAEYEKEEVKEENENTEKHKPL